MSVRVRNRACREFNGPGRQALEPKNVDDNRVGPIDVTRGANVRGRLRFIVWFAGITDRESLKEAMGHGFVAQTVPHQIVR